MSRQRLFTALAALFLPGCVAQPDPSPKDSDPPAPEVAEAASAVTTCSGPGQSGYNAYKNLYWGDLHLHTAYSLDAYSFGTRTTPATAYLFAKGQATVHVGTGTLFPPSPPVDITQPTQPISRALDFLAVTDHSEFLAVVQACVVDKTDPNYPSADCQTVRKIDPISQLTTFANLFNYRNDICGAGSTSCAEQTSAWANEVAAANQADDPCHFSALVGYEWTNMQPPDPGSQTASATNHRNVIFASGAVPSAPYDSIVYDTPPKLWQALAAGCDPAAGCDAVTLPHNSNMSSGVSLQVWDTTGLQQRYQVSAEIYQHKGASECVYRPLLGYPDPACGFEALDQATQSPERGSFVRYALEDGIQQAAADPAHQNHLKLGIVGATDDHNGAGGWTDEKSYVGHAGRNDDEASKRLARASDLEFGSGALTGAWAEQNTRASIFGAIQRRETFATSGPRIRVRFLQTSDLAPCLDAAFPKRIVDAGAVTMGGTFGPANVTGVKPRFAISAWPDAYAQSMSDGTTGVAPLVTVQVIKARVDAGGVLHETVSTVPSFPQYGGCVAWSDDTPFSTSEHAFYYVRVLQKPTWRWSHWDCQNSPNPPSSCSDPTVDTAIQERAWTSPIWFTPT